MNDVDFLTIIRSLHTLAGIVAAHITENAQLAQVEGHRIDALQNIQGEMTHVMNRLDPEHQTVAAPKGGRPGSLTSHDVAIAHINSALDLLDLMRHPLSSEAIDHLLIARNELSPVEEE